MHLPGLKLEGASLLPWRETKVEGVAWIPLFVDADEDTQAASEGARAAGRRPGAAVLIRMQPGCGYGAHRHVGSEDVLVLEGGYADEFGTWRQGDHVHYSPGSVHTPCALGSTELPVGPDNPACILYSTVPEGIELLDS